jgi:hypothetical protein
MPETEEKSKKEESIKYDLTYVKKFHRGHLPE